MSSPKKIAHFEILKRIGAGGMGEVFLARDEVLDREIALKLIRRDVAGDTEIRHRFLREARLAAAINHSGVATLYEAGETEPGSDGEQTQLYLASELVDGSSLEEILRDGVLPLDRVVDLGIQLAEALGAAHDLGIVHRDIKPSNVMVTRDGSLKVLDFGIAKRVGWVDVEGDSAATLTYTSRGAVVGTPAYMAPEQVAGGPADARTDIHGTGCVLYQMLTGHAPFGSGSPSEIMRRVIVTPPKPLRNLRSEVPRGLAAVVEKALAKEPEKRYQSAAELADALRDAGDATGIGSSMEIIRRGVASRKFVAAVLIVLAVLALVVGKKLLGPRLPFDERDWLLVSDVVNATGDEGFTLALKSALETDLRQSRHVNIYDAGRARNTLQMMRRDPAIPIDLETGIEVCRFGGVRALLIPRIDVVDEVYILQASLVEPATGRTVDRIRLTAKGRDQVLLETIDELTRTVRRHLGESLQSIAETDPPLVQYTTSSWEAQRLLAMGSAAWAGGRHLEAERSFRMAIEEDPQFATARGSLGLLYIQFLGRVEEGRQLLSRAFEDADEVSRREYLVLRAIHSQFVDGDLEAALADYALVNQLYPDVVQPLNNSGRILSELGRHEEAVQMYERAREIDAASAPPLWNLWTMYMMKLRRPEAGEEVARELVRLQPESSWAHHSLGWTLVALRRFDEAEVEMLRVLELDPAHPFAEANLSHLLFRRGAFAEAETLYRKRYAASRVEGADGTNVYDGLSLAATLQNLDRWDEARVVIEEGLAEIEALEAERVLTPDEEALKACVLAALARVGDATGPIEGLAAAADSTASVFMNLARALTLAGDPDRADELLVRAFEAGYDDPYFLLVDPLLNGLQGRAIVDELAPVS